MKAHLLFAARDFDFGADLPSNHEDLVADLELTTVLGAMAAGDVFLLEVAKKVMLTSLTDPEEIRYRQSVLADCVAEPEVIRRMYAIAVDALTDRRGIWGYSSKRPSSILSGAVSQLEAFVGPLKALRSIADDHGDRFGSEGFRALFSTLKTDLDDHLFEVIGEHLKRLRFRNGVLLSAQLGRDGSGIDYVLRSTTDARAYWKERLGIGPRSSYSFTIPPRDEAGGEALAELTSRGVNLVANAAAQSADHIISYFSMLRAELGFYVGCLNLRDRLTAKGEPISSPAPSSPDTSAFSCSGLCDVALALRIEDRVVGNDVAADGKELVIVTGANSGGKSTFLRSAGQAQLMLQCGMFVVADYFRASACEGIFTHFIREEDSTMASGRLDEELARMSAIAERIGPHCLALFNESFAATNEREGSEIGRQVVTALLEGGVRVFFVTHQYDFAHSFETQRSEGTLFLRAERQRTYKLVPAPPLPTSFGADLYRRLGGWLGERDGRPAPSESTVPVDGAASRPGREERLAGD